MTNIFGQFDVYMKKIERSFHVTVICRDEQVKLLGSKSQAEQAKQVISQLLELSKKGSAVTEQNVDYAISLVREKETATLAQIEDDCSPKRLGRKIM